MKIVAKAPAKINLTLDITGKKQDGYHTLKTVFQSIDWYDRIVVESLPNCQDIVFSCSDKALENPKNTAYKAATLFKESAGIKNGFSVFVEKSIPQQAGLAGGSADAAGVLAALNCLCGFPFSQKKLCKLGANIGADVPFCLLGGTALGEDTGIELTPLLPLPSCYIVVVKPEGGVSTPQAYTLWDTAKEVIHPDTDGMCSALAAGDMDGVLCRVANTFEKPLSLPHTQNICRILKENGAQAAALSGSGSAVFGIFQTVQSAKNGVTQLQKVYSQTKLCKPCEGIILTESE